MGKGARRRAVHSWACLWEDLRSRASSWSVDERSPAVPALREAARQRGVDLEKLVHRMREVFPPLDDWRLAEIADEDESIAHDLSRQCALVEAVLAEIENGGPEGLSARAYFAVDGTEIDESAPAET